MIIHREKRWLVVTPPRCGSHTLNLLLTRPQFGGEIHTIGETGHHNTEPPAYGMGCTRYLLVRNPFARAVSLWRYWSDGPSFEEFAKLLAAGSLGWFYRPLSDYGEGIPIRLEHLAEDLASLGPSGPYITPHETPSHTLEPWQLTYDREPDAASCVRSWAAGDLEWLKYGDH
jgi:hypothetical protein